MGKIKSKHVVGSLVTLITFAALSGCASGWVKPGATSSDFAVDQKVCEAKAKATNDNQNWSGPYNEGILANKCLEELGWARTGAADPNRAIASLPTKHK